MKKLLICTPQHFIMCSIYVLSSYNSRTIQDIKFTFSAVLSFVEATKCIKFQSARCTGFKEVGIFRIK